MPDPDEPLEVLINASMARERNLAPGDRLRLDGLSAEGVDRYFGAGELDLEPAGPPRDRRRPASPRRRSSISSVTSSG